MQAPPTNHFFVSLSSREMVMYATDFPQSVFVYGKAFFPLNAQLIEDYSVAVGLCNLNSLAH